MDFGDLGMDFGGQQVDFGELGMDFGGQEVDFGDFGMDFGDPERGCQASQMFYFGRHTL